MKKLAIFMLILSMPIIAGAETVIKLGFMITHGQIEELKFSLSSVEFNIEKSVYKNFSVGFGFRKETRWGYSGYYLSLYPMYKIKLSKNWFINSGLGAEYGLASSDYDYYGKNYDQSGNLIAQKWIYLIQNAPIPFDMLKKGSTGTICPFMTFSCGTRIWKGLIVEMGIKAQMMRFEVKSCKFEPETWRAYDIVDKKSWEIIPSLSVQIGYKF